MSLQQLHENTCNFFYITFNMPGLSDSDEEHSASPQSSPRSSPRLSITKDADRFLPVRPRQRTAGFSAHNFDEKDDEVEEGKIRRRSYQPTIEEEDESGGQLTVPKMTRQRRRRSAGDELFKRNARRRPLNQSPVEKEKTDEDEEGDEEVDGMENLDSLVLEIKGKKKGRRVCS